MWPKTETIKFRVLLCCLLLAHRAVRVAGVRAPVYVCMRAPALAICSHTLFVHKHLAANAAGTAADDDGVVVAFTCARAIVCIQCEEKRLMACRW